MPFELDPDLPRELAPLAWLAGRWEGAGTIGYPTIDDARFAQEVHCFHDGRPLLEWHSHTWLLDEQGERVRPLASELGFWRPLPNDEVELVLSHSSGVVELYYGRTETARVELVTDGVIRSPHANEYSAGKRLYGLVSSRLMWAMDMAAMGLPLQSHASAELVRVEAFDA
ncbi:FABP family protein [Luteipulveratus sp. YIM 133132]|uniref:Peroxynitrite isomerase n=1 Tax=Luteipulveratus flavus TaxID=3031728 RepID=A0ABT6C9I2_9MICO|nr:MULTISPECIES: FABP family protein [unclassified Luteipulveratus]MDE9365525.1 FABP family protein [Luteipulveratus sp. YIM 133132]MDF8265560.1 FABP family protein [Luteipulveratus sp. YIM 133296]